MRLLYVQETYSKFSARCGWRAIRRVLALWALRWSPSLLRASETLKLRGYSADTRHQGTLSQEGSYDSWTQNLFHDPPHACPTPDAPGVAACNHHTCGTSPACPAAVTPG